MYGLDLPVVGGAVARRISLTSPRQTQWNSILESTNKMRMKIDTLFKP